MLIKGSCRATEWCYFADEAQKRFLKKYENKKWVKNEDSVLLYDNCKCHISGFSAWFMR